MGEHLISIKKKYGVSQITPDFLDQHDVIEMRGRSVQNAYRYWKRIDVDPNVDRKMLVVLLCPPPPYYSSRRIVTEERLKSRARLHGFGRVGIIYLYARRVTGYSLAKMTRNSLHYDILSGEMNDAFTEAAVAWADEVFYAYGKAPKDRPFARLINIRATQVYTTCAAFFKLPRAFQITDDGWPAGPIGVNFSTPLDDWRPPLVEPKYPKDTKEPSILFGLY